MFPQFAAMSTASLRDPMKIPDGLTLKNTFFDVMPDMEDEDPLSEVKHRPDTCPMLGPDGPWLSPTPSRSRNERSPFNFEGYGPTPDWFTERSLTPYAQGSRGFACAGGASQLGMRRFDKLLEEATADDGDGVSGIGATEEASFGVFSCAAGFGAEARPAPPIGLPPAPMSTPSAMPPASLGEPVRLPVTGFEPSPWCGLPTYHGQAPMNMLGRPLTPHGLPMPNSVLGPAAVPTPLRAGGYGMFRPQCPPMAPPVAPGSFSAAPAAQGSGTGKRVLNLSLELGFQGPPAADAQAAVSPPPLVTPTPTAAAASRARRRRGSKEARQPDHSQDPNWWLPTAIVVDLSFLVKAPPRTATTPDSAEQGAPAPSGEADQADDLSSTPV